MIDFTSVTSVTSAIQQAQMWTKFNTKKKTGTLLQKDSESELDPYLEQIQKQQEQKTESDEITRITNKVMNGKELSKAEREYLQKKNPTLYQTVKQLEQKSKAYEKDISNAKTKDEVQRIRANHTTEAMSSIKSVENSHMDEGMKTAFYSAIQMQQTRDEKTFQKYIKSGAYHDLPTEEEVWKAKKPHEEEMHPTEDTRKTDETEVSKETTEKNSSSDVVPKPVDTDSSKVQEAQEKVRKSRVKKKKYRTFDAASLDLPTLGGGEGINA